MKHETMMTSVWLDMSCCLVPGGYDPRRVRPSIESALKRTLCSDDLVITSFFAYGDMKRLPESVIQDMASSGISMRHSHFALRDIMSGMHLWKLENPPPANVMLISTRDPRVVAVTPYLPLVPLEPKNRQPEYNVIRGFPSLVTSKELLWDILLQTEEGGF